MAKPTAPKTSVTKSSDITLEGMVALTNYSKTFLLERAREGYFKSDRHGVYKLGNVILGLIRYFKEARAATTRSEAAVEVQRARAEQIRQSMAVEARDLISFKLHGEIVDTIVGGIVATLNGLPSMLTRDPALRSQYAEKIEVERKRLCRRWAELAKADETALDPDAFEDDEATTEEVAE